MEKEMMRRTLQSLIFLFAILFTLTTAPTASAQVIEAGRDVPKVDVFGGFSYMRADTVVSGSPINLYGGSGSVAYNFNQWLGIVGNVGYYHANDAAANRLGLDIWSYQAGPRVSLRKHDPLVPFAQVLFGAGHAGGSLYTRSLGGGLAPIGRKQRVRSYCRRWIGLETDFRNRHTSVPG
jgi:hypothetical protein